MRVFLGITGASGAPYAARLIEVLASSDVELGVSSPPWSKEAAGADWIAEPSTDGRPAGLTRPSARSGWQRNGGDEQ